MRRTIRRDRCAAHEDRNPAWDTESDTGSGITISAGVLPALRTSPRRFEGASAAAVRHVPVWSKLAARGIRFWVT